MNIAVFRDRHAYCHSAFMGEFHGISRKIKQNLIQASGIPAKINRNIGINLLCQRYSLFFGFDAQHVCHAFNRVLNVEIKKFQI